MQNFNQYSLNDRRFASHGQEGSAVTDEKIGVINGGVYLSTSPSLDDGDYGRLQLDSTGNLKVGGAFASSIGTIVIPTSDTVTAGTLTNTFSGVTRGFTFVTPAMEATGTATLTLTDTKGGTLISQTQAESGTVYYGTIVPMTSSMKWIATANGTQSAAATTSFIVHYER